MANRSSFVAPNYTPDNFAELFDLPPSKVQDAKTYNTLRMKENKTNEEITQMNNLAQGLQNYLITPERWNHFCDALKNMQLFIVDNVQGYIDDKQVEFQEYIDRFTDKGIYNPSTQYYAKNYVTYNDGTGDNVYLCYVNCIGITPTNTSYWRKLGMKGAKGNDGVGLVPKGTWNSTTTYAVNNAVYFGGIMFACLVSNTNQQPSLTGDTTYWAKAWNLMITLTRLKGYREITGEVTNVNFIVGEINAFNPLTDSLDVYCNTTALIEGVHYSVNANNQSIDKIGIWGNGTAESPDLIEFRVVRNMINNLVFSDGQSISDGTLSLEKLNISVQEKINNIDVLSGISGVYEKANKSALDITNTNLNTLQTTVNQIIQKHNDLEILYWMGGM